MELKNIDLAANLYDHLRKNGTAGLILLLGDDFYIQSSLAGAVERYYTELCGSNIIRLNADSAQWSDIETSICCFDIFSPNKLVVLSGADTAKLKELSAHSNELTDNLGGDKILLVLGPHLKKDTLKTGWFTKLKNVPNYTIQFYPPEISRFPRWLVQEAAYFGFSLDMRAACLLAESYEGNIGGAVQTIKTIGMQGKNRIADSDVMPFLSQSTRFVVFEISDALLAEDSYRSLKILHSLETQGDFTSLLLAELNKMLSLIMKLKQSEETGVQPQSLFRAYGIILQTKQNQYYNVAKRMPVPHLNNLLKLFALINRTRMTFDNAQTMRYLEVFTAFFSSPRDLEKFLIGTAASNP